MTETDFQDLIPVRNETVHRRHRKEVFWQITFPLILGTLLLLGVCGLTVGVAVGGWPLALWRDISMIWLLLPALILALIVLAIVGGLAYGVIRLIGILPGFFYRLQRMFETVAIRSRQIADRIVVPVLRIAGWRAGIRRLRQLIR